MSKKQEFHGMSNHPLYSVRKSMIQRVTKPSNCHYALYGGRGIKICEEWLKSPSSFFDWALKNGYKRGMSIDRIDNNGDYCPENCRWVTQKEQTRNTRRNNKITFNGETMCISDWAKKLGFSHQVAINKRIKMGWSVERALSVPCGKEVYHNLFLLNNKVVCLEEICKITGFRRFNYYARKQRGKKTIKELFDGVDFSKFKIEEIKNGRN